MDLNNNLDLLRFLSITRLIVNDTKTTVKDWLTDEEDNEAKAKRWFRKFIIHIVDINENQKDIETFKLNNLKDIIRDFGSCVWLASQVQIADFEKEHFEFHMYILEDEWKHNLKVC